MTGKSCKEGKRTDGAGNKRGSKEAATLPAPNRTHIPLIQALSLSLTHTLCSAALSHSPSLGAVHAAAALDRRSFLRCLDTFRSKLFLCRRLRARSGGRRGGSGLLFCRLSPPPARVVLFHMRLDDFTPLFAAPHHTCVMFLGLGITGGGTFLEDASSSALAAAAE